MLRTRFTSLAVLLSATLAMAYPTPSPYPVAWEFKFEMGTPKRFSLDGKAYWYVTYTVTNNTNQERTYLPIFEVLGHDGKVTRTDRLIPLEVVKAIKTREGIKFLEQANEIAGPVLLGQDQSRDGVAIWPEQAPTSPEDRDFTVFASGFSGETAKVEGPDGKEITLYKTLKVECSIPGDPKFRDRNPLVEVSRSYVFR